MEITVEQVRSEAKYMAVTHRNSMINDINEFGVLMRRSILEASARETWGTFSRAYSLHETFSRDFIEAYIEGWNHD